MDAIAGRIRPIEPRIDAFGDRIDAFPARDGGSNRIRLPCVTDVVELVKDFRFEAAHWLPNVPEEHKCRRIHGHSFRGEIAVRGPLDPKLGWVMDFADLKRAVDPLVQRLDHYMLNEIEGLENPTAENLAIWIWRKLAAQLPNLHRVTIEETCTSRCHYFG